MVLNFSDKENENVRVFRSYFKIMLQLSQNELKQPQHLPLAQHLKASAQ